MIRTPVRTTERSPHVFTEDQLAHFTTIVDKLDQHPVSTDEIRLRRAARINIRTPVDAVLLSIENLPTIKIFSRNLSTSGIGFVSRRLFKPRERFVLVFPVPDELPKLVL